MSGLSHIVKIGNILPEEKNITCQVPQCSILGPILFLLYINDTKFFFLFADDTITFLINKKVAEIEKTYNEELKYVSKQLKQTKSP